MKLNIHTHTQLTSTTTIQAFIFYKIHIFMFYIHPKVDENEFFCRYVSARVGIKCFNVGCQPAACVLTHNRGVELKQLSAILEEKSSVAMNDAEEEQRCDVYDGWLSFKITADISHYRESSNDTDNINFNPIQCNAP